MDNMIRIFTDNLYAARKHAGLTQQETANRLFLCKQSYASYERGRFSPSIEMIGKIAELFGVTPDYFFKDHTKG